MTRKCENCRYRDEAAGSDPCCSCFEASKWEARTAHEELVTTLRNNADHYMTVKGAARIVHLLTDAADAIEELSKRAEEWEMIAEGWRKGCKGLQRRMQTQPKPLKDDTWPEWRTQVFGIRRQEEE